MRVSEDVKIQTPGSGSYCLAHFDIVGLVSNWKFFAPISKQPHDLASICLISQLCSSSSSTVMTFFIMQNALFLT